MAQLAKSTKYFELLGGATKVQDSGEQVQGSTYKFRSAAEEFGFFTASAASFVKNTD